MASGFYSCEAISVLFLHCQYCEQVIHNVVDNLLMNAKKSLFLILYPIEKDTVLLYNNIDWVNMRNL